jgi:AcrR family transcriptional regulator
MTSARFDDEEEMAAWAGGALIDSAELARRQEALEKGGPGQRVQASALTLGRTVLVMAGELGYRSVTVEELTDRSGSNRARFYDAFADKESCFSWAYGAGTEALCDRLLGVCSRSADWASGVRLALLDFSDFVAAEPEIARGLLIRPGDAGPAVAADRQEMAARFLDALDATASEKIEVPHPAPSTTPRFIFGAIEAAAVRALSGPEERNFAEDLPGLLYMAIAFYFGPDRARAEVRKLPVP